MHAYKMCDACLQLPAGGKKGRGFKAGPLLACGVLAMLILGAILGLRITNIIKHSRTGSAELKQQTEDSRSVTAGCLQTFVST